MSLFIYIFFFGREKRYAVLLLSPVFVCDWILSAILDSCARVRALDLSDLSIRLFLRLSLSLRNARSRLKRPLRHPFHAVRAKSLLLQIRKLQICIVGCCQSRERIVVPGGDSPGVLGWLHGG